MKICGEGEKLGKIDEDSNNSEIYAQFTLELCLRAGHHVYICSTDIAREGGVRCAEGNEAFIERSLVFFPVCFLAVANDEHPGQQ